MLKTKTVLVCHGNTVLDQGILSVLNDSSGLNLAHTVSGNMDQLLKDVEINHPDVIVLCQGAQITRHTLYRNLPITVPPICMLTICLESNHVCINQNQIVRIYKASDIIDLILNNTNRP